MFLVPPLPPAGHSHILPTFPHPRVWPSLIYPKTPRPIIQSQPQCPLVTLPHPLFYLSLALIASAMYYPYFSVIMQYDEKLRRLRRNIYSGNFRSYMVRRNTRALSFFFSPFLTFADAHTDPRSIASRHSKRDAMVSTARTVQLIIRLVRGWISANKVHKVICPTSPLYNTHPRTSTLPYTICQAQDPYVQVQSAQRGI